MVRTRVFIGLLLVGLLIAGVASGCAPAKPETESTDEPSSESTETTEPTEPAAEPEPAPQPSANAPSWATYELTDVRTGETFALADLAGEQVFIQAFATW